MRRIVKRAPPNALTQWRQPRLAANRGPGMECTYGELRRDDAALNAVENALFTEQGGICAYTGHPLKLQDERSDGPCEVRFHIEHLKPQARCRDLDGTEYGEDTDYRNMVACWPPPNWPYELPYGAKIKGNWPTREEDELFVSPLMPGCTQRFKFSRSGKVKPADPNDVAALETIKKLRLDHPELTALRKAEIDGKLKRISPGDAKRLIRQLQKDSADVDAGQSIRLNRYCFAVEQALEREISKLEGIRGH